MENNFDHIERFFNGTLNQEEIANFEKRRATDKEFDNEVILYRQALNVIKAGARNRMKQRLDDMGSSHQEPTKIRTLGGQRQGFRYWYAVAASILFLTAIGIFTYKNILAPPSTPTLASLYDYYYEVPKADLAMTRGDTDNPAGADWNLAIGKYSEGQFADALVVFRSLLENPSFTRTSTANFYLGICYLNLGIADSAVYSFNKVSQSSSLVQDASWYLGMSYLKSEDRTGAENVFKEISLDGKHYKKKEAQEILRKLSRKP